MNENADQLRAIRHLSGPMLVLAGPGSGKTTVITHRVRALICEHGVRPEQILVITFTKAAALEMRDRFRALSPGHSDVSFSTFHSCFFTILRYAYNYRADSILKESDGIRILSGILRELGSPLASEKELVLDLLREFGLYKGNYGFLSEDERAAYLPVSCDQKLFYESLKRYDLALRSHNKVDFEDMLLLTRTLLSERPDILSFWQNRYPYILIDEFQDINLLQYEIVKMLAKPRNNLFIVGDCDQSIYGFRGSRPELMLHFPKDYPDAVTVSLSFNYRSSAAIISASERLIRKNAARYDRTTRAFFPDGPEPVISEYATVEDECADVIGSIRKLLADRVPPERIAVLYRTNLQPRLLTERLKNAEITYSLKGSLPLLYDCVYLQPILAYLRISIEKPSRNDVLLVSNKPTRYLTRDAFPDLFVDFGKVKSYYRSLGKDYVAERINRLQYDLKMISGMNAYAAVFYIRKVIGYDLWIRENVTDFDAALEQLEELLADARDYGTVRAFLEHIAKAREEFRTEEAEKRKTGNQELSSGVRLMTFHGSKGLEFDHVFLLDCNETLVPHKKALFPEQIEEERRLLYVAMTRARKGLTVCYVKKRFGRELKPSRFLAEITGNYSSSSTSMSSKSSSYI